MLDTIQAEHLKHKRTFHQKLIWLIPIMTIVLALILMSGAYVQVGAYNWWYIMLLPAGLTLIVYHVIRHDVYITMNKKQLYRAKLMTCVSYLTFTCLLFFVLITIAGLLFGSQLSVFQSFSASILLLILFLWQIPFWMLLSLYLNIATILILSLLCNFGLAIFLALTSLWFIPFAIPARIMCSVIGVLPNGLMVEAGSPLLKPPLIVPGCLISITLFLVLSYVSCRVYASKEN